MCELPYPETKRNYQCSQLCNLFLQNWQFSINCFKSNFCNTVNKSAPLFDERTKRPCFQGQQRRPNLILSLKKWCLLNVQVCRITGVRPLLLCGNLNINNGVKLILLLSSFSKRGFSFTYIPTYVHTVTQM